jgi:hypothetical protein
VGVMQVDEAGPSMDQFLSLFVFVIYPQASTSGQ